MLRSLPNNTTITIIKSVSTLTGLVTRTTWVALGLVVVGRAIFVGNGWRCPLTDCAERLGAQNGSVADIFLPSWLAKRLPVIAGTIFALPTLTVVIRAMTGR